MSRTLPPSICQAGSPSARPLRSHSACSRPESARHQHRSAAVEAATIADLPDVLDIERVGADESVAERLERAIDRFGPAFEARFAPADRAVLALDPDEQPARRREEGLDPCRSSLGHAFSASDAWVPLPPNRRPGRIVAVVVGMLADLLDRHDQADARGRKHVAPIGDQLLVGLADVADLAVEVEQPERIDVAVLLAQRGVPVDLVGQAIPGEADGRDADVAQAQHVGPFLPQPFDGFVAVRALPQVGLGMHHRQRDSGCNIGG